MKEIKKEILAAKGWTKAEIERVETIIDRPAPHDLFFSKIVFWSALLLVLLGNAVISLVAIPFLIVLDRWLLYILIVILAAMIGLLYNFLINDIGYLEQKHHLLASVLVPILAVINIIVVVSISNNLIRDLKIKNSTHSPWALSLLFALAFILPFVVDQIRQYLQKK